VTILVYNNQDSHLFICITPKFSEKTEMRKHLV